MTPIGQPCSCEPMTWLYFVFGQSVLVLVELTLTAAAATVDVGPMIIGSLTRALSSGGAVQVESS
jgi:hypothetical protein